MNGRENLQVWRIHNNVTKEFQELATGESPKDGNYTRDGTKGVFIYSQYFSTYTLSSTAVAGPSGPSGGSGSSSKNYGGSMWAQNPNDVPTVAPTVAPTAQPTQPQKSPAPVVSLIAGLGIAALVLARARR